VNDASSARPWLIAVALLALSSSVQAQVATQARIDSLIARVERSEERIRLLEQQLATEAQSAVKTRSRMAMEIHGRVLVNAFTNSRRVNSTGGAGYVLPDDPGQLDPRGIAMSIRQTSVGIAFAARDVLGADFLGDLDVDFHGGQLPSSGGRTFALARMRTARAILKWPRAELLLGQESPLLNGVSPVSLAAVGTPLFAASGNLWLWLPQARLTVETTGRVRFGAQGAIVAPGNSAPVGIFEVSQFDNAERSRRPFVQGRLRATWGEGDVRAELGLAGHLSWYKVTPDSLSSGYGTGVDLVLPIRPWLELRAEAYDGKGMRSLGGGAIGQLFGFDGRLIRSRGGWAQLNAPVTPTVSIGAGMGLDDPNDTDVSATSRLKNVARAAHVHWRPSGPLVFGFEYRNIRTHYATGSFVNHHLNLAFGFEF
jgi:hypothetical protein